MNARDVHLWDMEEKRGERAAFALYCLGWRHRRAAFAEPTRPPLFIAKGTDISPGSPAAQLVAEAHALGLTVEIEGAER